MNPIFKKITAGGFSLFAFCSSAWTQVLIDLDMTGNSSYTYTNNSNESGAGQYLFRVHGNGPDGASTGSSSSSASPGSISGTIANFTQAGQINLSPDSASYTSPVATVLLELTGGDGGNQTNGNAQNDAGDGGNAGAITATNSGTTEILNVFLGPVSIFEASSVAGKGGDVTPKGTNDEGQPEFDGGNGGQGGLAGFVNLSNTGSVEGSNLEGNGPLYGIRGLSQGGDSGEGQNGKAGGAADGVQIDHSGSVSIDSYTSQNPSSAAATPAWGIFAEALGGDGSNTYVSNGSRGGNGGNADGFALSLFTGSSVNVNASGNIQGGAVGGISQGGVGGDAYSGEQGDDSNGGTGGNAGINGGSSISVMDATIETVGDNLAGIVARHLGGAGGDGADDQQHSNGGLGGEANEINIALASDGTHGTSVITVADNSPGILAVNQAGKGGTAQFFSEALGGKAGNGGAGGVADSVNLTFNAPDSAGTSFDGTVEIQTTAQESPGAAIFSRGGDGGAGGELSSNTSGGGAGTGGPGGDGGSLTTSLYSGSSIQTAGEKSSAVFAQATGGTGGAGGDLKDDFGGDASDGGAGGNTDEVTITIFGGNAGTIGDNSSVLVAQSLSGGGGAGGARIGGGGGSGGAGGAGGDTGEINISNNGLVSSEGDSSHGMLAQSFSGNGGDGGSSSVVFYGSGGDGSSSGSLGGIELSNAGTVQTSGKGSHGYLAQSLAGGGGAGGDSELGIVSLGGTNPLNADGGTIYATNANLIKTTGDTSVGMLLQSLGGGGGDGGSSDGIVSIGGAGGGGGDGGGITVDLFEGNTVQTAGDLSIGVVGQSIGGGGGNAGNASVATVGASLQIGGTGGDGGDGGAVTITSSGSVTTSGSKSIGILGQSIGGGGGSGGAAYSLDVSAGLSAAIAVGGSGGDGGVGETVTVTTTGGTISTGDFDIPDQPTNLLPVDAFGIVAQSIGGGGGNGGSAIAEAIAVGVPVPGTDVEVAAAVSVAMGGSGGSGGQSEQAQVTVKPGTTLTTQGQGSHGILVQSIGLGGGNGGDSSALSSTINYTRAASAADLNTYSLNVDVASGGSGGSGGDGNIASVEIGDDSGSSTPAAVTTLGDFANAVTVQSIGGGGGNAGIGSGNTQSFGSDYDLDVNIQLGATGGGGGLGGQAAATIFSNGVITTYGDGAHGLVAQSIGHGGGTSQGGTLAFGGNFTIPTTNGAPDVVPEGGVNFTLGATGGDGGDGGIVTLSHAGNIQTQGNDSVGILGQSIGGGGGVVGSSGQDAAADNPINAGAEFARAFVTAVSEGYVPIPLSSKATIKVGSQIDGNAGSGGGVSLDLSGIVGTQGDWSPGVFLQGIGGGGGKAGSAYYSGSDSNMQLDVVVGGGNSVSGNGGAVTLTPDGGSISTSGFSSFGVLLQSVGGGGGFSVDGSNIASGSINVGTTGTVSGTGGDITVESGQLAIQTSGVGSHGMVLQTIGGGGGIGGAGNGDSDFSMSSIQLNVGATGSGSQNAGNILVDGTSLNIITNGDYAYGLLAQSIGGSGGLGQVIDPAQATVGTPNSSASNPDGGTVSVTLGGSTNIQTRGDGAHGVVLQSIAGGGGISGFSSQGSGISVTPNFQTTTAGSGNANPVNFTLANGAQIKTFGNGAHGLVAQSIGDGGGIVPNGDGTLYFGSTNGSGSGIGREVTINVSGQILVIGNNDSVGIFAQSTSGTGEGSTVTVNITSEGFISNQTVDGSPAIWVDGGDSGNVVNIATGGVVESFGSAVKYTGNSTVTVNNSGIVQGSLDTANVAGANGRFNNLSQGTWHASGRSRVDVVNSGVIEIGNLRTAPAISKATIQGNFEHRREGTLVIDADFLARRADVLTVEGDAQLEGRVAPRLLRIAPSGEVKFAEITGDVTGGFFLDGNDGSLLFDFAIVRRGNEFFIRPAAARFVEIFSGLSPNQLSVAEYFGSIWEAGGNSAFNSIFTDLNFLTLASNGREAYLNLLNELSPGATFGFASRGMMQNQFYSNIVLNGPVYEGGVPELDEVPSTWARIYGSRSSVEVDNGYSDFRDNQMLVTVGGQAEVSDDWFLGGSLAYQYDDLKANNGSVQGSSDTALAAVTLKRVWEDWTFSSAITGSAGWGDTTRRITTLPGTGFIAEGSPSVQTLGAALRAAYTHEMGKIYLRPDFTLSGVYVHADSYTESGAGVFSLDVDSASQSTLIATPGLEFGVRTDLEDGKVLRSYVRGNLNLLSNDGWEQDARFVGAPVSAGGFTTTLPIDQVSWRLYAGVQLQLSERTSTFLQYEGEYSESVTGNGGAFGVKIEF